MNRFDRWGILLLIAALAWFGTENEWLHWGAVALGWLGAALLLWSEHLEEWYWRRKAQRVYAAAERRRAEMEE